MQDALGLPLLLIALIAFADGPVAAQGGNASPRSDAVMLTFANSDGEFDAIRRCDGSSTE